MPTAETTITATTRSLSGSGLLFGLLIRNRQRELKDGSLGPIGLGPEPSSVTFDNRTADRQPHAKALRLSRIKRVEKTIKTLRIQPWARISHGNQHLRPFGVCQGSIL